MFFLGPEFGFMLYIFFFFFAFPVSSPAAVRRSWLSASTLAITAAERQRVCAEESAVRGQTTGQLVPCHQNKISTSTIVKAMMHYISFFPCLSYFFKCLGKTSWIDLNHHFRHRSINAGGRDLSELIPLLRYSPKSELSTFGTSLLPKVKITDPETYSALLYSPDTVNTVPLLVVLHGAGRNDQDAWDLANLKGEHGGLVPSLIASGQAPKELTENFCVVAPGSNLSHFPFCFGMLEVWVALTSTKSHCLGCTKALGVVSD